MTSWIFLLMIEEGDGGLDEKGWWLEKKRRGKKRKKSKLELV